MPSASRIRPLESVKLAVPSITSRQPASPGSATTDAVTPLPAAAAAALMAAATSSRLMVDRSRATSKPVAPPIRTVPASVSVSPRCTATAVVLLENTSLAAPAVRWCFTTAASSRKPSARSTPAAPSTRSILPSAPERVLVSTSRCSSGATDTIVAVTPAPLAPLMRAAMLSSESVSATRITVPLTRNSPESPSASERDATTPPASFSCVASARTRTRYEPTPAPGPVVTKTDAAPAMLLATSAR